MPLVNLITPAQVHDIKVGWFIILISAILFGFHVLFVYADSAYFDWCLFNVAYNILEAHPAVNHNVRRSGKCKLVSLFFLE